MAETPLTDAQANALSGATDSATDAVFPTIGESPYHTTLYRVLHRVLTIAKAVNGLRVYKDGELTFGVRPGAASAAAATYTFAGATGQALADDQTNYVYLVVDGSALDLVVNTTGLPDPAVTPHVPLAIIQTGAESIGGIGGAYDAADISDLRGRSLFRVVGG